jgi:hypothetical protein
MQTELTRGALEFKAFLAQHGLSLARAASSLKTKRTVLYYWIRGVQRPRPEARQQIERLTKGAVPSDWWFTAEELRDIADTQPFEQPAP